MRLPVLVLERKRGRLLAWFDQCHGSASALLCGRAGPAIEGNGGMGASRLGAPLHLLAGDIHQNGRRVAVADFALAPNLRKLVAASDQILEKRSREPVFDFHALSVVE